MFVPNGNVTELRGYSVDLVDTIHQRLFVLSDLAYLFYSMNKPYIMLYSVAQIMSM